MQWPSGNRHSECSERICHRKWEEQAVLHFAKQWIPQDNKEEGLMESLKKAVNVTRKAIYDIETLFSWLLVVGQQRSIDIAYVFQFELSPVPPALIDGMAAWWRVTRPCSSSLSVYLSWLHLLHMWLMVASLSIMLSGQSLGLQETWLQASAFDWPITLLSPRKLFFLTDMTKKIPAQRTTSGQEEEEPRQFG